MQMIDSSETAQSGTQILHPGSRKLFRYWEGLRAERPCPNRSDVDLRQIATIMPNMSILEKHMRLGAWTYRLVGTAVAEMMPGVKPGSDVLSGWDHFERDVVGKALSISLERKQPCLVRMRYVYDNGIVLAAELIALPIFDEKTEQVQLFGGIFPFLGPQAFVPENFIRRELVSARMIWTEHETGNALMRQVGRMAAPHLRVIQGGLA